MKMKTALTLASELLPLVTLIIPNISEAEVLSNSSIRDKKDMEKAGDR